MPCYDSRDTSDSILSSARHDFRHNSDVAEMLCDLLKNFSLTQISELPVSTKLWWIEHQKRDIEKSSI